jgi:hypothetical protein
MNRNDRFFLLSLVYLFFLRSFVLEENKRTEKEKKREEEYEKLVKPIDS